MSSIPGGWSCQHKKTSGWKDAQNEEMRRNLRGDFFEVNNNLCVERHSLTINSSDGHNQRDETVKQRKIDWEATIHHFRSGRSALRATLMRQARSP
jgi:hypothetical protein